MSVLTTKPKFLYPKSRMFPFDEVTERIVRELEKRNWSVPGITVDFHTYGTGEAKYRRVEYVYGENFKLYFCRPQGSLSSGLNDTAAVHDMWIPNEELTVYDDGSGPTYFLYVGDDWNLDKSWFMDSIKVHSKLRKKPRKYIRYKRDLRTVNELIYDDDIGREYEPEGDEPRRISIPEMYNRFKTYLEENVLQYIESFPEEEAVEEPAVELIHYEGPWKEIFSLCDYDEKKRITQGMNDPQKLTPENRHAYFGSGRRLVGLSVRNTCSFSEKAYDGFIWADTNPEAMNYGCLNKQIKNAMGSIRDDFLVSIILKYANNVYVVDNALFEETRMSLFEKNAPRDTLSDEEMDLVYAERAKTLIPITEYKGGYKEPLVLICRELDFDEINWISEDVVKRN